MMHSTKILLMTMLVAASGLVACSGAGDGATTGQVSLPAHGADAARNSGRHDDMDDQDDRDDQDEDRRDAAARGDDDDQGEDESHRADGGHGHGEGDEQGDEDERRPDGGRGDDDDGND